jgi:hypothetical protein
MDARPEPNSSTASSTPRAPRRLRGKRLLLLLLVLPFIGGLWVSSYQSLTPTLWGIPFFYWYQLLWVVIAAVITLIAYLVDPE